MKIKPINVLFNILAIVTALAVIFVGFNIFGGAKGYAVVSDSMAPKFNKGDLVFVKTVEFNSLKEGDIVTVAFYDNSGYFTHKITKIDYEAGIIKTKGDANPSEDPSPSMAEQVVGKYWYSVPLLGYVSIYISSLNLIKISVILAVVLIVIITLSTIVSKTKKIKKKR